VIQTTTVAANKARTLGQGHAKGETKYPEFEALFIAHWQSVFRTLRRLIGDVAEAEDLALETFWRLYQQLPVNRSAFNYGGWLYRVSTNLGLNALRSRKRRKQRELQVGKWEWDSRVGDPADEVTAQEDRELVRAILADMDARQAQLLFLRHSGMSYAELAAALDLTPSSVGTLLARAEREFEKRYRQKGV
jgi:RNA polymerase sigma-70 factor, ECF subfamily